MRRAVDRNGEPRGRVDAIEPEEGATPPASMRSLDDPGANI
jgi:hypothetical protein